MNAMAATDRHEELRLLSAVLEGDAGAGRHFFERYNVTVERCVRRVLRRTRWAVDEEEVKDIVSDIWVSLLEDNKRPLRRFDPSREVRVNTWISLLARNKTIDHLRTSHQVTVSIDDDTPLPDPAAASPLPVEMLEEQERRELAWQALGELRPEDRSFLEAWYVESQDPEAMASELGISVGTVYSRRFKIQEKLTRVVHRQTRRRQLARRSCTIH